MIGDETKLSFYVKSDRFFSNCVCIYEFCVSKIQYEWNEENSKGKVGMKGSVDE